MHKNRDERQSTNLLLAPRTETITNYVSIGD